MKGNQKVIDALNHLLGGELTAMDQYFIHSEMYADWGLNKLYERIAHEFDDEKQHAKALIERILFLEGKPDMVTRPAINIGANVKEMLSNDLKLEYQVVEDLKNAMALCEKEQDYQTREILRQMLGDTEMDHAYWLEIQLGLIERIGMQNYQQSQL
ncbi:bacterioferritin [Marinospirillum sp.]|uniref:bacterioferritin n=1 Tax=Marinospirillum sp. TaxID=2183934 RepID=UPI0028704489|nr:bacterioferritin [Marinospirillum sp.]MDR9467652.1 bacterioferritin [Marinospirillum sp.]